MVLKRLFVSNTGEDSDLHIHWSGTLSPSDSFTQEMFLERPFISHRREDFV